MLKQITKMVAKTLAAVLFINLFLFSISIPTVFAAQATSVSDNISRLKTGVLADHELFFVTPTGVDVSTDTIILTFGAGFTVGASTFADIDLAVGSTNVCSSATFTDKTLAAAPSTSPTWGAVVSGQVMTLTAPTNAAAGEITADRCVRIRFGSNAVVGSAGASRVTNGSAGSTSATVALTGTFGDVGSLFIPIITDDQVVITATVDTSISFSISTNAISFGTLVSSGPRFATSTTGSATEVAGHTMTAGTNATAGYVIYVKGDTLRSGATNTITPIGGTAAASTIGSEQFGLRITASGGNGTSTAPYNDLTPKYAYAASTSTQSSVGNSAGPSAVTTFSAYYIANISTLTEAGSYGTTLTYTAVGTF
jgi:hypothetical protein